MTGVLEVFHRQRLVGTIREGESGGMHFAYSPGWQSSPAAFPVSLSLPLTGTFSAAAGHNFFANLLPEGNAREQICRELRISQGNDFGLLAALGGDCAGALTVVLAGTPPTSPHPPVCEPLTESELAAWSTGASNALGFFSERKRGDCHWRVLNTNCPSASMANGLCFPVARFPAPTSSSLPHQRIRTFQRTRPSCRCSRVTWDCRRWKSGC